MPKTFINYIRVSTEQQGRSGLGLEAQKAAVGAYLAARDGALLAESVEVETGRGADALSRRLQLRAALDAGKRRGAWSLAQLQRVLRRLADLSAQPEG